MRRVKPSKPPPGSLLAAYTRAGSYTDCYTLSSPRQVTLAEFITAFYTTRIFKLERWLLARFAGHSSTDTDVRLLAEGKVGRFAAWHVEARDVDQALLASGRTRSWLRVVPEGSCTTLCFGSVVVPREHGGLGWQFSALLGFHKLYSRMLLASAARQLVRSGR